jgi:hypothetical protein
MRISASWLFPCTLVAAVVISSLLANVRAGEEEKYLPADSQMLIRVNVKQIIESPLVKKDVGKMRQEVKKIEVAQKTLDDLGFDLFRDLDSITLAGSGPQPERTLVLASGRFDVARFRVKADEVAKEKSEMVKVIRDGDQIIYQTNIPGQGRTMFVAVVDGSLLAAAPTQAPVSATLAMKARKGTATLKPEMKKLLAKTDPTASISIFALGGALKGVAPQAELIKQFTGTITITEDVRVDLAVAAKDSDAAKNLGQTLRGGLEQAKSFLAVMAANQKDPTPFTGILDNFKVEEQGTAVTVKGSLSKEFLEQLNKKP